MNDTQVKTLPSVIVGENGKNSKGKKEEITQTRQQLQDKLTNVQSMNKELIADIKEIAKLIKVFKDTVGFPNNVNIGWVIMNRKAILKLIQDIIKVLKNKNNALGLGV